MIATTNLVQNMDAAFERSFLYKVKRENSEKVFCPHRLYSFLNLLRSRL